MSEINQILDKIQTGEVSPEDAVELIENLKNGNSETAKMKNTMDILKGIESGELSPSDGISKLGKASDDKTYQEATPEDLPTPEELQNIEKWWRIPWYIGLSIFIGSGMGISSISQNYGFNFWVFLLLLPLLIGFFILVLTWPIESKPWVHVRVRDSKSNKIKVNISIPVPINFASWIFKFSRIFIPDKISDKIDQDVIENTFAELADGKNAGNPFHVHVDDGGSEIVDVYIG